MTYREQAVEWLLKNSGFKFIAVDSWRNRAYAFATKPHYNPHTGEWRSEEGDIALAEGVKFEGEPAESLIHVPMLEKYIEERFPRYSPVTYPDGSPGICVGQGTVALVCHSDIRLLVEERDALIDMLVKVSEKFDLSEVW